MIYVRSTIRPVDAFGYPLYSDFTFSVAQTAGNLNLNDPIISVNCLEEIDGQMIFGYALFKDRKSTKLSYPLEKFHSDVSGRSFHNGSLIQRIVKLEQGTVTSLLEDEGTIGGVQHKTKSVEVVKAFAPLTIVCDGCLVTFVVLSTNHRCMSSVFHIGHREILKLLMGAHTELSMKVDISSTTALHTSAMQGNIEVMNSVLEIESILALIARGNRKAALHPTSVNGHARVVKALLNVTKVGETVSLTRFKLTPPVLGEPL
ncbi:squalene epoxidase 1 [Artemisia annua]|uniref:Squalene monooxygenase n=1 Tax=Artemisia annua TaxID=35608 RepID=A0A2U1LYV2_ARTAN|nr:squalene epoxidase 1 [Artemisia annua]